MFQTHSLKDMKGYSIHATDGEIGKVDDFYFDDDEWTIRYLVVDTGNWLSGRKVLLAPEALGEPDETGKAFPVHLTRQQVQDSPDINTERPVSRQQEETLRGYYGWASYWAGFPGPSLTTGVGPMPVASMPVPVTGPERPVGEMASDEQDETDAPVEDQRYDPNLRSFETVKGYRINADDGEVGKLDDFIVEDEKWTILYMIVDTGNLFSGRKVLVAPSWTERVSWEERKIDVNLKVETIKNSPEYDPSLPLSRDYEEGLYRHYNKPYEK